MLVHGHPFYNIKIKRRGGGFSIVSLSVNTHFSCGMGSNKLFFTFFIGVCVWRFYMCRYFAYSILDVRAAGTGVIGVCELPRGYWISDLGPLEKQRVLNCWAHTAHEHNWTEPVMVGGQFTVAGSFLLPHESCRAELNCLAQRQINVFIHRAIWLDLLAKYYLLVTGCAIQGFPR